MSALALQKNTVAFAKLKNNLPTMYDLPSEDLENPGLPDEFHAHQPQLLRETFCPTTYPANQIFTAADMHLYYDLQNPLWYKSPDWFAVVGVSNLYEGQYLRNSYVMWQEKVNPLVVVELLSDRTKKSDLGQVLHEVNKAPPKWKVYEQILKIPYYIIFSRRTKEMQVFKLENGRYKKQKLLPFQKFWIDEAKLGFGVWKGKFRNRKRPWLRCYDEQDHWIKTPRQQEKQRADFAEQREQQQKQRADLAERKIQQEKQRIQQIVKKLKRLGIDPKTLGL